MDRNTRRGRGGRVQLALGLVLAAGLAVAACGGDDDTPDAETGDAPVETTVAQWGDENRDPLATSPQQWGDEQRDPLHPGG